MFFALSDFLVSHRCTWFRSSFNQAFACRKFVLPVGNQGGAFDGVDFAVSGDVASALLWLGVAFWADPLSDLSKVRDMLSARKRAGAKQPDISYVA